MDLCRLWYGLTFWLWPVKISGLPKMMNSRFSSLFSLHSQIPIPNSPFSWILKSDFRISHSLNEQEQISSTFKPSTLLFSLTSNQTLPLDQTRRMLFKLSAVVAFLLAASPALSTIVVTSPVAWVVSLEEWKLEVQDQEKAKFGSSERRGALFTTMKENLFLLDVDWCRMMVKL